MIESFEDFLNEKRSITKVHKEYTKVVNDLAELVTNWKAAKESGAEKAQANFLARLKELTAKKKALISELDDVVGLIDVDAELAESHDETIFEMDDEAIVTEAKSFEFTINYNTGDDDKAYVEEVLRARGVDATVEYGTLEDDIIIKTKNAAELRKAKKVIQADGFEINESVVDEAKVQLKRRYTENHPAITVGKTARVRNKMLEAIADGKITQEEFNAILKEFSSDSKRWMQNNTKYFSVSEDGISLSTFGKRALGQIKINKNMENNKPFIFESFSDFLKSNIEYAIEMSNESRVDEAKSFEFTINYNTGDDDKAYVEEVLRARGVDATVEYGTLEDDIIIKTKNAAELRKAKKVIQADGFEINESVVNEGTRGQFGIIDKKGNIQSVYTHYDSYPENVLPLIKKYYKNSNDVNGVIAKGDNSGLDAPDKIKFYGDDLDPMTGKKSAIDSYLKKANDGGGAEYVYLYDEADKKWYMADVYAETGLVPAFESVVNENMELKKLEDAIKMFQDKIKSQGMVTNARDEDHLENLIRIYKEMGGKKIKESVDTEIITEAFKSSKLRNLMNMDQSGSDTYGQKSSKLSQGLYGISKIKLDEVEDADLIDLTPEAARKEASKSKDLIVFYIIDNEKENPYADRNSSKIPTLRPGILAVTRGKDFLGVTYKASRKNDDKRGQKREYRMIPDKNGVGGNKNYRGYDASGIYNVKRAADLADRAIVFDMTMADKSAKGLVQQRADAQSGAIAFKSGADFKKANLARYREILATKASKLPLDKVVEDTINILSKHIADGIKNGEETKYGELKIGEDKMGRDIKITDASNMMSSILSDYQNYVSYTTRAEKETGSFSDSYKEYAKEYAKYVSDRVKKVKNMDYAW